MAVIYRQLRHLPNPSPIPGHFLPKNNTITCVLCAFLSLALLHYFYCSPLKTTEALLFSPLLQYITPSSQSPPPKQASSHQGRRQRCDYSEGRWVRDAYGPRYNGTSCNVKDSENCMRNGRPDTGYLYWRWQPVQCDLPAFGVSAFLSAIRDKHIAFVGDSMARNQAESLVCLLSTVFPSELVYRDKDPEERRFWRWAFPSHNVTVSTYWAPFLVKARGKSENFSMDYNSVFIDTLALRWSADADTMDIAVLSIGHWFFQPSIYYNGSTVLSAHLLPELNHTEIGFFPFYREVIRRSLERLSSTNASGDRTVVMATFSPAHSKGWDDPRTCTRKEPYKEGEREVGYADAQLRRIAVEEATEAAAAAEERKDGVRFEVLDVTKLATMRPDGHPGVYMYRDPFADGVPERLKSDCLHFCLPGPVDTFNEILLQLLLER